MQVEVGAILDGKVTGITNFGAFVALPGGKSGLVHISEVANTYVRDVHEFLSEQQEVRVKVIGVSPQGKISLSIKQAAPAPPPRERRPERSAVPRPAPMRSAAQDAPGDGYVPRSSGDQQFEDKLKRFMQESDGKMSGNKLFQQQRKGQRRRK
ncbi:MAG: S1 RNA-binding domain-containing protein [Oscillospiraceae bacterium]|nr:S1 RNA-binding domain-containing protein [Oscillospiraceae bacterium]